MISMDRNKVKENMQEITNEVMNDFASQSTRLQLLLTTFKSCFLTLGIFARA